MKGFNAVKFKGIILCFYEFLKSNTDTPKFFMDANSRLIENAYKEKNLKLLKDEATEMHFLIKQMPVVLKLKLREELLAKFDYDIQTMKARELVRVKKVVDRGHILNNDEYSLVFKRVQEIYTDKDNISEVKVLNHLLKDYING